MDSLNQLMGFARHLSKHNPMQVMKVQLNGGLFVSNEAEVLIADGRLGRPGGMDVGADGSLYITSSCSHQVLIARIDTRFLSWVFVLGLRKAGMSKSPASAPHL